jgi:hypothetical protein
LHTYRVYLLSGTTPLASSSFLNLPTPGQVALSDDMSKPRTDDLLQGPLRPDWPDTWAGYENGEYVIRINGRPIAVPSNVAGPAVPVVGSPADGILMVTARLSGETRGQQLSVGCRATGSENYQLVVGSDGTITLVQNRSLDQLRNVILERRATAAVNLGNAPNQIVLRCVGQHISAAINGVEVLSVDDPTLTTGNFFLLLGTAADGKGEARWKDLTLVAEAP